MRRTTLAPLVALVLALNVRPDPKRIAELLALPARDACKALVDGIQQRVPGADWDFILRQRGMFSLLGLSADQVKRLKEEFAVYVVGGGRVNVAGITQRNLEPLWPNQRAVLPPHVPTRKTRPTFWAYETIRPLLLKSGELTPIEKAERRVLVLANPGHGLENMRRRAAQLGGSVTVEAGADGGARVVLVLPLVLPAAG